MALKLIEGGVAPKPPPYFVVEVDESDALNAWQVCQRTGEVARVDVGDTGRTRGAVLANCIGWCVSDKTIADAFCAAMNERWAQDEAEFG